MQGKPIHDEEGRPDFQQDAEDGLVCEEVDQEPDLEADQHGGCYTVGDAHHQEPGLELHKLDGCVFNYKIPNLMLCRLYSMGMKVVSIYKIGQVIKNGYSLL